MCASLPPQKWHVLPSNTVRVCSKTEWVVKKTDITILNQLTTTTIVIMSSIKHNYATHLDTYAVIQPLTLKVKLLCHLWPWNWCCYATFDIETYVVMSPLTLKLLLLCHLWPWNVCCHATFNIETYVVMPPLTLKHMLLCHLWHCSCRVRE